MQKRAVFYVYISRAIRAGRCRERRYADHIIYSDIGLLHAPFRSQIFKICFASGGKGALTPQPKSCGRSCSQRRNIIKIPFWMTFCLFKKKKKRSVSFVSCFMCVQISHVVYCILQSVWIHKPYTRKKYANSVLCFLSNFFMFSLIILEIFVLTSAWIPSSL